MKTKKEFIESLKPWMVFKFKDIEVSEYIPHYFVIINKEIINAPVLVLPVSTSQIEKRIAWYERCNLSKECLVIVEPGESNNILFKQSVFDCNEVKNKWILDLYELYEVWKANYEWILPDKIINKLRNWVMKSNQVEIWIKELI